MSGSRHARTCGGPSIVAATRRNALRDTLPTCRRAALPHALDRDTCPAFISQSSTIVKAASPSIRRTRSPSAARRLRPGRPGMLIAARVPPFARASFLRHFPSRPAPLQSRVRACSARCSATAAHRCCPSVVFRFRSGSHRLLPHRPRGRIAHGHARVMARACGAGANLQRPACERVARDYRRAAHACAPDRSRHRRPHPARCASEPHGGEKSALIDGAGALAFVLPALGARQPADAIVAAVDGLLFTGSYSNVEPHHYGGAASAPDTLHDPRATRPRCR